MFRLKLLFCFIIIANVLQAQQLDNVRISTGITYANSTSQRPVHEDINPFRYGFWVAANHNLSLKKWLSLDLGITYQERMAMEFFDFTGIPDRSAGTHILIRDYPSNPQHDFFRIRDLQAFPNFKYLHFEAIPTINFGKKIKTSIGIGVFTGVLLNKNKTTKTPDDFPEFRDAFEQLNVRGIVQYNRFDAGWIPKISCLYYFTENIGMGIELKSYHSLVRMNDNLVDDNYAFNFFWIAYSGGFSLNYEF